MGAASLPRVLVLSLVANLCDGETALSMPVTGTQSGCSAHLGPCAAGQLWVGHVLGMAREAGPTPPLLGLPRSSGSGLAKFSREPLLEKTQSLLAGFSGRNSVLDYVRFKLRRCLRPGQPDGGGPDGMAFS